MRCKASPTGGPYRRERVKNDFDRQSLKKMQTIQGVVFLTITASLLLLMQKDRRILYFEMWQNVVD